MAKGPADFACQGSRDFLISGYAKRIVFFAGGRFLRSAGGNGRYGSVEGQGGHCGQNPGRETRPGGGGCGLYRAGGAAQPDRQTGPGRRGGCPQAGPVGMQAVRAGQAWFLSACRPNCPRRAMCGIWSASLAKRSCRCAPPAGWARVFSSTRRAFSSPIFMSLKAKRRSRWRSIHQGANGFERKIYKQVRIIARE